MLHAYSAFNEKDVHSHAWSLRIFYTIILVLVIIIRLSLMNHETEKTPSGQVSHHTHTEEKLATNSTYYIMGSYD